MSKWVNNTTRHMMLPNHSRWVNTIGLAARMI